jgi:hypothetical protein
MTDQKVDRPIVYVLETKHDITDELANDFLKYVAGNWKPNEELKKEIIKAKQINDETPF